MTKTTVWGIISICLLNLSAMAGNAPRKIQARRVQADFKIDGLLLEEAWKTAPVADQFTALRPVPFVKESPANASRVYFLYNNEGIYVGGYMHESTRDSIATELIGRDGFGNNDFVGVIFDTYHDKLNAFEYFVTPLGEQMDAKFSPSMNGNSEDFSWNAVWQSASAIHNDGWSFEMFIPYAAIRFGGKQVQDWGFNIVRRRQKSGQQLFWQPIDPTVNGFLTQAGVLQGLENIKPPLRLQFSPYFSSYLNHDATASGKKTTTLFNGGMDVKYGINQAFTIDMTLIPDFGQVQTDNKFLNLSPFEQRFAENRTFFTEGIDLFNKGNLFYSRRIGMDPRYRKWIEPRSGESIVEDPGQARILNATKLSGRTQKGLGIGVLNAVTQRQTALLENKTDGSSRREETMPLSNYNIIVLDQTLKNNSSVSLVNTNVWRSGADYDANVTSGLFDLNDKKNTWNVGGNVSVSNLVHPGKTITGYAHSLYFGKTSGRFNFSLWQDLFDAKYDKSDMGFFTNNNTMDQGLWMGYQWNKPKKWFNQMRLNFNSWYSRLVSPIDPLRRNSLMYQNAGFNINGNAQTKKLQWMGFTLSKNFASNDFYEPRKYGRHFHNKGNAGISLWYESNFARKYSWYSNFFAGTGDVFDRVRLDLGLGFKMRLNNRFSFDLYTYSSNINNQAGWAGRELLNGNEETYFSRRDVRTVENVMTFKYNFNNKMGLTFRGRHSWTKVTPREFYLLDPDGNLVTPSLPFTGNARQNFNFMSGDLVYTWQFAQGSFFNIVWKDISGNFSQEFEKNYFSNLGRTIGGNHSSSLSVKVIYFLDYLNLKKSMRKKR
ncbi:MAG TPA: hypothetical protein DHV17_09855 [Chitinophagaceae bacterium]|nr:hypothetical protein [Chitinophagaceae bacterium]